MRKRYIIACSVCECLTEVARRDALTCSTRCRVYLHRHPGLLDHLREICRALKTDVFDVLECRAVRALCPAVALRIEAGELTLADVRTDVVRTFVAQVMEAAAAS